MCVKSFTCIGSLYVYNVSPPHTHTHTHTPTPPHTHTHRAECRVGLVGAGLLNKDKDRPATADKDSMTMSRFLNRILGLSVFLQNKLFAYFSDTLAAVIKKAKRIGKWDLGIMDFGASGESVDIVETLEFIGDPAFGTATTNLHKIKVERGMSFNEALDKLNSDNYPGEGFYVSKRVSVCHMNYIVNT